MIYITEHDIAALDAIRKAVDLVALPNFHEKTHNDFSVQGDNDLFRRVAELRAFSGARSSLVSSMIKGGAMTRAFGGFDVARAAQLEATSVIAQHWDELKVMRFKRKINEILEAAKVIAAIGFKFGSFNKYLENWQFPKRITHSEDIERFWQAFDALQEDLKSRRMPIIRNEITLLHFLENDMHLDCLKPDVVVIRVATNVCLIPGEGKGKTRLTVKKIQEYCAQCDIRPSAVDKYLLAFGGQTWAQPLVKRSYCTKLGGCASPDCPVGTGGHCPTWKGKR